LVSWKRAIFGWFFLTVAMASSATIARQLERLAFRARRPNSVQAASAPATVSDAPAIAAAAPAAATAPAPTEKQIAAVITDLFKFQQIPPATCAPRMLLEAIVGWLDPSSLPANERRMIKLLLSTVRRHPRKVLFAALRRYLAPRGTLAELQACTPADWGLCKELYVAKLFDERKVPRATLERLRDPQRVPSRAEWAAAFGIELRRPTRWRPLGHEGGSLAPLRAKVAAQGDRLDGLSLREVLTVALPMPTIGEGWGSPLSAR
jgi:hypothetical protein